jgi:hypothetical protein
MGSKKASAVSAAEEAFAGAFQAAQATWAAGIPEPDREHMFHAGRRWRFDFAWPEVKLAVEIEGRGRHQTVVGARQDCDKYNTAAREGWRVLRFPATDLKRSESRKEWPGGAREWIEDTLEVMCNAR